MAAVIHDEFDRACIGVVGHLGNANGGLSHLFAQVLETALDEGGGRFFDDLLIAPLDGAVAFAEVNNVAAIVAQDLELDVMRIFDEFFDVNTGVAERLFRFAAGGMVALDQGDVVMSATHPATAAAGNGFNHYRIADLFGRRDSFLFIFHHSFRSGGRGNPGLLGQSAADSFVLQGGHGPGVRADEPDVAVLTHIREVGVLRQEPVAAVDGIDIGDFRGADDAVDAQVTIVAGRFADANGLVRQLHVHGIGVRFGIDGHRPDVQFFAGADDANGDFASIRYQNFLKHVAKMLHQRQKACAPVRFQPARGDQVGRILNRGWPNSTGLAFSTRIWVTTPLASALISFITFIASIMQTTVSGLTSESIST